MKIIDGMTEVFETIEFIAMIVSGENVSSGHEVYRNDAMASPFISDPVYL
jgi:hypothetical protein